MAKAEVGLSAQRIYQDLVEENSFTHSAIARRSSRRGCTREAAIRPNKQPMDWKRS